MIYLDQLNRTISLPNPPKRIVSLVPSQTELLVDLGLRERIVGITKFCIHPKGLKKEKMIIGGTKNFYFDKIESLQPDLIIGNKEENYKEGIEKLAEKYPVWMSDIYTLEDAYRMILGIGELTDTSIKAIQISDQTRIGKRVQFQRIRHLPDLERSFNCCRNQYIYRFHVRKSRLQKSHQPVSVSRD
ncbi:helical backbone metal receptor [Aquiflexum sp. TKW24L]|uniref:helical backbone metal receptor n=1 Tax=Aquiflexum sp. TKW24L TaxID=2942212 RepID=UPI0032DE3F25